MTLDELKRVAMAATPGEWTFTPDDECDDWTLHNEEFTYIKQDDSGVPVSLADGTFMATFSPARILRMLDVIEKAVEMRRMLSDGEWPLGYDLDKALEALK